MLQSWVGSSLNRKGALAYSFSDRADSWPVDLVEAPAPALDGKDGTGLAKGLIAGTLVATEMGWMPAEELRAGDRVVTFDNGMRALKAVRISSLWTAESDAPRRLWPISVPARALGNRSEIRLLPEQAVLIESDVAEEMFGDPFAMISAASLEGFKGIVRVPPTREVTVVSLVFETAELVYVNGTTLVQCPNDEIAMVTSIDALMTTGAATPYQHLSPTQMRRLMRAMHGNV
jgi:hypothetical protein